MAPGMAPAQAPARAEALATCQRRIADLRIQKDEARKAEDFLAAEQFKVSLQEEEERLQALQESMDVDGEAGVAELRQSELAAMEAKVAELKELKEQKLRDEDFLGAHEVKCRVQEHEKELQRLRSLCKSEVSNYDASIGHVTGGDGKNWFPVSDDLKLVELRDSSPPFRLPSEVFDNIYDYQREAVQWLAELMQRDEGGVLADEMGLGKTVELCSFFNGARKAGASHALILVPVSLADQWMREAKKWCPGWPVYHLRGSKAQRERALRSVFRPAGGILIASYNLLASGGTIESLADVDVQEFEGTPAGGSRRGRPAKRRRLDNGDDDDADIQQEEDVQVAEIPAGGLAPAGTRKPWDIIVCDEAHRMKNISSLLGKSMRQLSGKCRLLLTGTPVQNALQDLWSLFDFAMPGLLGNHATFVKTFSDPIDRGSFRGANSFDVELKKHLARQLRGLIEPYFLRRTKKDVGLMSDDTDVAGDDEQMGEDVPGLPPKRETVVWLTPSEDQAAIYRKVLEKSDVVRQAATKQKLGIEVFCAIGLLKRLCNHTALCTPLSAGESWRDFLSEAMGSKVVSDKIEVGGEVPGVDDVQEEHDDVRAGSMADRMLKKLPRSLEDLLKQSAKLKCLDTLLPRLVQEGHRILVFSHSTKMLDLIHICVLRRHGLRCLRIDGATEAPVRAEKVNKFNEQGDRFQVMLLTTQVGGVGLNLTGADRVILVDPAWNPAVDAQAVDRAFRIGQTREVRVYRLILSGMIEDKMFRLQVFKMGLAKSALEGDQQHRYFSAKEINALFEWVEPTEGETRKILSDMHAAGLEAAAQRAVEDAGDWIKNDPVLDVSDFNTLFSGPVQEEVEVSSVCEKQLEEAKLHLGAADEKAARYTEIREQAEKNRDDAIAANESAIAALSDAQALRGQCEETMKSRRSELSQARKVEAEARKRLEVSTRGLERSREQFEKAQADTNQAEELATVADKSATEGVATVSSADEGLSKAFEEAGAVLDAVDDAGRAVGDSVFDADKSLLKKCQRQFDKAKLALETAATRQAELVQADSEVGKAEAALGEATTAHLEAESTDKGQRLAQGAMNKAQSEVAKAENALIKAQQRFATAQENGAQAVTLLMEIGTEFTDSFVKAAASEKVLAPQVKKASANAKNCFRQASSAWKHLTKMQELYAVSCQRSRKAQERQRNAFRSELAAKLKLAEMEAENAEAVSEEDSRRAERVEKEKDAQTAEEAFRAAEKAELEAKNEKDRSRVALSQAKEAVKPAKAAEKEATVERQTIYATCSKVESKHARMEEKMSSALETLKNEEYRTDQVLEQYNKVASAKLAKKTVEEGQGHVTDTRVAGS